MIFYGNRHATDAIHRAFIKVIFNQKSSTLFLVTAITFYSELVKGTSIYSDVQNHCGHYQVY